MTVVTARPIVLALALLVEASPAAAQWTRVEAVPASDVSSVWANGDTIAAGTDSTVYFTADAGLTWKGSVKVVDGVTSISAAWVRNGRIYAGTFGQGVFVSDDRGDTWAGFNQGLVGGFLDTQLRIVDILVRGDSMYVATSGAGVWVRNLLGGTWSHFGAALELNGAADMLDIASGGTRLLVSSGFNGTVFFRDSGDADWTLSLLENDRFAAGLASLGAAWTGTGWVVAANNGVFRSELGQEPWTFVDLHLGLVFLASLVPRGHEVIAVFNLGGSSVLERSIDDGATWEVLDSQPNIYELAIGGADLYAGRVDGLWRRSVPTAVQATSWSAVKARFR